MKKLLSLLIVLSITLCCLTSCNLSGKKTVIEINETTLIDTEIFSYFLNELYYEYDGISDAECIDRATSECLEYVAVNTHFAKNGGTLSAKEKADVSNETNALWRIYGDYYQEIGVSKETFFKIRQYDCIKENIRLALYDKDGTMPLNEEYIKQYFTANYVGIKYFYEELYKVLTPAQYNALTDYEKGVYDSQKKSAEDRYRYISEIANYVNSSVYTMDEAFMAVTGEVSADISVSAAVVSKTGSSFSEEFVKAVFNQAVGSAFIITNSDKSHVYFIERVDLLDDKYGFYEEYRAECLKKVSESFLINEINSWITSYKAVRHLSKAERCLKVIKNVDRSKYAGTENYQFQSFLPKNPEAIK